MYILWTLTVVIVDIKRYKSTIGLDKFRLLAGKLCGKGHTQPPPL